MNAAPGEQTSGEISQPSEEQTKASSTAHRHWQTDTDIDGVLWLTLDREGEKTNSLSQEVLEELDQIITEVEKSPPAGLVM